MKGNMFAMASPSHVLETLDTLPLMVYAVSRESALVFWNCECERVTGWKREDVLCPEPGMERLFPDEDCRRRILSDFDAQGRKLRGYECRISCKAGERRILALSTITSPLFCSDWSVWGMAVDVTDRKEAERALENAVEDRFRHFGQELHDGVVQELTAVSFILQMALRAEGDWERLRGLLDQGYSLVCRALEGVQQISRCLFPSALDSEGLVAALESMAHALECGGDTLCDVLAFRNDERVDLDDATLALDSATATHLFRIAQEAVRNAVTHGRAEKIRIEVRWTDTDLQLIVRDDGSGFRGSRLGGLGLESMKRRADILGGAFAIAPGVGGGGGTVVRCRIPVSEAWQDGARSDSAV